MSSKNKAKKGKKPIVLTIEIKDFIYVLAVLKTIINKKASGNKIRKPSDPKPISLS